MKELINQLMKLGQRGPDEEDEGKGNSYLFIAWTGIVLDALGGGVLLFSLSRILYGKRKGTALQIPHLGGITNFTRDGSVGPRLWVTLACSASKD